MERHQVDESTQSFVRGELSTLREDLVERINQPTTISDKSRVRFVLSLPQMWGAVVAIFTVVGSLFGAFSYGMSVYKSDKLAQSAAIAKTEQSLRQQMIDTDLKWQKLFREATTKMEEAIRSLKSDSSNDFAKMRAAIAQMPDEYPPRTWLDTVYLRDREEMREQIKQIREELKKLREQKP